MPLDDVARDRQPEAGPAAPEAGTVGLVEALEDPRPVGLRDADAVIDDRRTRPPRRPGARRTRTSPPSGLNLIALWTRLTNTWPRRASSPRTVGTPGSGATTSVTPLRSANRRSRSTEPSASGTRSTSSREHELAAALDPREVEQLVDHLDEVAGLDLDLRDPLAHPRRDVADFSASRASVSASRLTVLSGVRSSWLRLSMNSDRICWRRRSSVTSSSTTRRPLVVGPMDADDEDDAARGRPP